MSTLARVARARCECGKPMRKSATRCDACERARWDAHYAEQSRIVATGVCPTCGAALKRNSSLTGWWQCAQLGAENFRADPTKPSCSWQTFTRA